MDEKIYIQIASYRDPELYPTIKNCIENCDKSDLLSFGIIWQRDEEESLFELEKDPRLKIICVHYSLSKGACWARNKLQYLYEGEKYTMQLDSHHRFVKGWDTKLKKMYNNLINKGIQKPLITAYLPSYNPETYPINRGEQPLKMVISKISKDRQILFKPHFITNIESTEEVIHSDFYSAHFAFTIGDFVKEIPHDQNLYFIGEEMNITIRAFTNGYTLYHPNQLIAWHEYTRRLRKKHWEDDSKWWVTDAASKKYAKLTISGEIKIGTTYGLGTKRKLEEN